MKKTLRILSVFMTIVLCATAMTACSLFGPKDASDLIARSEKAMSKVKNFAVAGDVSVGVDMDINVAESAIAVSAPIKAKITANVVDRNAHGIINLSGDVKAAAEINGEKQEQSEKLDENAEFYVEKDNKDYVLYTTVPDAGSWTKQKISESDIKSEDADARKNLLKKTEMTKDKNGYKLTLKTTDLIDSDFFNSIIKQADATDTFKDSDKEQLKELFKDTKITYSFDKKYRITNIKMDSVEIDLADLIKKASEDTNEDVTSDGNKIDSMIQMVSGSIKKAKITIELNVDIKDYDKDDAAPIKISSDIKENATESTIPDKDNDSSDISDDTNESIDTKTSSTISDSDRSDVNTSDSSTADEKISDNWEDMDIMLDGKLYKYPYDFAQLKADGWNIDLSKYGKENGYIINAGEKTYSTLDLTNDKYGKDYNSFTIGCGFKNYDSKSKDLTECDLWSISLACDYGKKLKEKYPEVKIAKGIHFGSTEQDIKTAFGEPSDTYEATDLNYKTLTFEGSNGLKARFKVSDEFGLVQIEYQNYN